MDATSFSAMMDYWFDRWFNLTEKQTTIKREVNAGTTSFFTMAYILAVNPAILSAAGMDSTAVMLATCLASAVGTMLMGLLANLPFAMSAGMGLNAYFAYTVVIGMGYAWEKALLAVFMEGVIFIALSLTGAREAIFNAIPKNLKLAVSAAIGLFIAFIGMQNVKICVSNSATLVGLANFRENFETAGICIVLFLIGIVLIGLLLVMKIPGAMLVGILITWAMGIACEVGGLYVPNPEAGFYSLWPHLVAPNFAALGQTFGKCFSAWPTASEWPQFIGVVLAFLFVDIFDTLGTLTGGAVAGNMLDENGELPEIRPALFSDAVATSFGAVCGTSTITTFVESAAGIMAGGRTGLTAIVTGLWFLVSTFAASFFTSIPSFATAPALIIVGAMMLPAVFKLEVGDQETKGAWDYTELIPVFLCLIAMVIFYSISEGIAFGIISYVVINCVCSFCGKPTAHKVSPLMICIAAAFILKYIWL